MNVPASRDQASMEMINNILAKELGITDEQQLRAVEQFLNDGNVLIIQSNSSNQNEIA